MNAASIEETLRAASGKRVEIQFRDGHVVLARVVSTDFEAPAEVIYDVLEVLSCGPDKYALVRPGVVAAAPLDEISKVLLLP